MGRKLISLVVYKVYRMRILSHVDLRKMRYGMEVIFNELIKIIILLILFAALNRLTYFLFSMIILITIRCFSGGLHFQTNLECLLFSIIFFIASTYEKIYMLICSVRLRYLAMAFSIIAIGLLSPVTSINRPIKNKRKQRLLKINAVLFTVLWAYILLYKIEEPSFAAIGIITIVLQALQLIASYATNRLKGIDISYKVDKGNIEDKAK